MIVAAFSATHESEQCSKVLQTSYPSRHTAGSDGNATALTVWSCQRPRWRR